MIDGGSYDPNACGTGAYVDETKDASGAASYFVPGLGVKVRYITDVAWMMISSLRFYFFHTFCTDEDRGGTVVCKHIGSDFSE